MKTMKKFLSMAALALVGAAISSCSNNGDFDEPQAQPQPASGSNVVTLTTTVGLGDGETRALAADGTKTFAEGDQMAVIYKNTSNETVKAEGTLTNGEGTKNGTFTVTLTDPDNTKAIRYIYPAAMAKETVATDATIDDAGTVDYTKLNSQDGSLAKLGSTYDLCTFDADNWTSGQLPSGSLGNQLAILALTLKNDAGGSEITSSITGLTVSDGTNSYNITRSAGEGPIYVAIRPTSSATIEVTATAGSTTYAKALSDKTYAANYGYPLTWRMAEVISGKFTVNNSGKQVYFSKSNLQATTSDNGTTWTWHFGPNQYARVGNGTANTKINGNGTVSNDGNGGNIDLFGWSTSTTHLGISSNTNNSAYSGAFVDWGSAKEVTDCIGSGWRTLTSDEWRYVTVTRSGNRFALALINNSRGGIILLPDDWNTSYYSLSSINDATVAFTVNKISDSDWTSKLEAHGAVFLPVTGQRNSGTTVNGADAQLHYWSSTGGVNSNNTPIANHLRFMPSGDNAGLAPDTGAGRCNGFAVRLVRDVE